MSRGFSPQRDRGHCLVYRSVLNTIVGQFAMQKEVISGAYLVLIVASLFLPIFAYEKPQQRKFAAQPNSLNKLEYASQYNNRIDSTEPISRPSDVQKQEAFSWTSVLIMALQFAYNILNPPTVEKSDGPLLQDGEFTWAKLLSVVIRVALAGLGADTGIDKSDNPATPLEDNDGVRNGKIGKDKLQRCPRSGEERSKLGELQDGLSLQQPLLRDS
ncbi:unnamed protein product [Cyprideis torosa]|uniref:Uncharacterized protein n=1 Tax=Cyprideis torosa TaxID=163714 RepID=A0A7R8ZND6_9CRUS|nr:unnamed protein product [Cyprideis torosa]CAG0891339.1 unnamed protein product [Cyprideis torosa]